MITREFDLPWNGFLKAYKKLSDHRAMNGHKVLEDSITKKRGSYQLETTDPKGTNTGSMA